MIASIVIASLLISQILATWESLYSPHHKKAYLRLSTDDILAIDYQQTDFINGDDISNIIDSPCDSNFSLALSNGDLYAFYANQDSNDTLTISKFNVLSSEWKVVNYTTTLTKNIQYYSESTFLSSLPSSSDSTEAIYIYGGKYNSSISNRLLEFDPLKLTLNSIVTSISPTSFYGGSSAPIDSTGKSSIVIGGKASSGWVSMFQIAVWEYKSWSFKTISTATFGVNSRIDSLILPVYDTNNEVDSLMVLGGTLSGTLSSPYVLNLNISDTWSWKNLTNVGDFKIDYCVGAFVLNRTLVSITSSHLSKEKRSEEYTLELFDVDSMEQVDEAIYYTRSSTTTLSTSSQNLASTSTSIGETSSSRDQSTVSKITQTSTSSSVAASILPKQGHKSSTTIIVLAVVIPIIAIVIIFTVSWFIYKKLYKNSDINLESDSESTNTEQYYKDISEIVDNQSISSWTKKREEYEKRRSSKASETLSSPTKIARKSMEFSFEPSSQFNKIKNLKHIYKTVPLNHRAPGAFVGPEDLEDETRTEFNNGSPFSNQSNKSRNSFNSSNGSFPSSEDYEEKKIEEILQNRDVQVLVSSKRRSKLRITNPDLESLDSIQETPYMAESVSSSSSSQRISSNGSGSISSNIDIPNDIFINDKADKLELSNDIEFIDNPEDGAYFKEVMKFFDDNDT